MRVALAGAGIGGLTAALAFDPSTEVVLLERAGALAEAGAGIQLSPNASRVLERLGLGEGLARIGFEPQAAEIRSAATGRLLLRQPFGAAARDRWGSPYLHVHRADLQALLAEAVAARPRTSLRLGAEVETVEADRPALGLAGGERVEADAVVGCDGLRSAVRAALWGKGHPRFTGMTAWRGTVEAARLPAGLIAPVAAIWTGPGRHFVHYYVRGGALVNFVGVDEQADWTSESWTERGDKAELARGYAGWPEPVQALIEAAPEVWRWALFDRPPLPNWSKGGATLLGDAAHPMLPSFAQGAAMAIEDAADLGRRLAPGAAVVEALAAYEAERRERTARVQALSRRNAHLFHRPEPVRRVLFGLASVMGSARQFDWLYEYGR